MENLIADCTTTSKVHEANENSQAAPNNLSDDLLYNALVLMGNEHVTKAGNNEGF